MATGTSVELDGVRIAYDDHVPDHESADESPPIVLVHGFASDRTGNWRDRDWYDALLDANRRVIALDCRGHGESEKPHDSAAYETSTMVADVVGLLDYLEIDEADLLGYSMGGRIGLELLHTAPDRVHAAVLGGIGSATLDASPEADGAPIADALEAADGENVSNPVGKRFRSFAETTGNDLDALAACARARTPPADRDDITEIDRPVLIVAGERDDLVGDPAALAAGFPNGEAVVVPGADHLTTVLDDRFTGAVLDFLERKGL